MTTGSGLGRTIACPPSECLPQINRTTIYAEQGTWRHWYLEHVGKIGADAALDGVPDEHKEMCEQIDLEGLPVNLASEVAFGYNWRTGEARELGRGLHRNYSMCGPDEIPGTLDAIGVNENSVYVGDYKGWALVRARDNAQLLFGALCGTKVFDRDSAEVEIINIRGGNTWRSKCVVDVFDLGAFAELAASTMRTVEDIRDGLLEPVYNEGAHCQYCPGFDSCPAKTKMLLAMAGGESIPTLNNETARRAYRTARAMQKLTTVALSRLYAYAEGNPIDLGEGVIFGPHETRGNETIDGDIAYELIRKRLGQKYADTAVTRKATKTNLNSAVRLAKKDSAISGTQKREVESILTELRASGAATRKPSTVTEEHRPKPAELKD